MSENFFFDNPDLEFHFRHLDLDEVLRLRENDFSDNGLAFVIG